MPSITAIILAAGQSTRFGSVNKLLADAGGDPVLVRVLSTAQSAGLAWPIVVAGHESAHVKQVAEAAGGQVTLNPQFAEGMGTSIAAGVRAGADADGWLIWPGDMPFVSVSTVRRILSAFDTDRPVVPVMEGRRGHPVLFPASFRKGLEALAGDVGARSLLTKAIELAVADRGIFRDIDAPADLP